MKLYEIYAILKPSLSEEEVNVFSAKTSELLAKAGFNVDSASVKLNERLTYLIKHSRQAHILTLDISGGEEEIFPETIRSELNHNENVLRCFVAVKSEKMILKRAKQASLLDQLRREKKMSAAVVETPGIDASAPMAQPDFKEIDQKLEEILK